MPAGLIAGALAGMGGGGAAGGAAIGAGGLLGGASKGASMGSVAGPWGAIAGGLLGAGVGLLQKAKANKWLKNNPYPIETLPTELKQNQEMAQLRANTGLPSEQYNNAMKQLQRQQLFSLRNASSRGGALALLGGLNQQANDSIVNLNVADANARLANQNQLMGVNNNVASVKRDLYQNNIRNKYNRDYDYNMQLKGAGNQNLIGGIDKISSIGAGLSGK